MSLKANSHDLVSGWGPVFSDPCILDLPTSRIPRSTPVYTSILAYTLYLKFSPMFHSLVSEVEQSPQ